MLPSRKLSDRLLEPTPTKATTQPTNTNKKKSTPQSISNLKEGET